MAAAPPAGGGAPPALPVPAPFTAKLSSLFADHSKDPTSGNLEALMGPFFHDLNNLANNTGIQDLKNKLAQSGGQLCFLAATILAEGKARLYTCPHRWDDGLTASNPDLDGKFFAFEGELIGNEGHTVVLPDALFHLINNSHTVPTIATIVSAVAGDQALETMGPYATGDANTEPVKTRRIVPVPHVLGGLWLSEPDGLTPRKFWEVVYPRIVTLGIEGECRSLLQFFQLAITGTQADATTSIIDGARPAPPARSAPLVERQQSILQHHFPQIRPEAHQLQAGLIAQGLGVLAQQNHDQYQETKREKELAKQTTVSKWLGATQFQKLLRMLRLPNEAALNSECPVYKDIAQASKAHQLGTLQQAINHELNGRGNPYLKVTLTPAIYENFKSLDWARQHPDSLTSGFLGNLLLWGEGEEAWQVSINRRATTMQSGETAISSADAQEILKLKVKLPMENKSLDNLRRLDIVCTVLLPEGHAYRNYVKAHLKAMVDFGSNWEDHELPTYQPAKSVLHCHYVSLRADSYWRQQAMVDQDVTLPPPKELISEIEAQRPWVPLLSTALKTSLKLDTFCRVGRGHLESGADGEGHVIIPGVGGGSYVPDSAATDISSITEGVLGSYLASLAGSGFPVPPPASVGGGGGGGGGEKTSVNNPHYNEQLFGEYKKRKLDGKPVKSKDIRRMITEGDLPRLPPSKANSGITMCLAWHTKGMCNLSCPCAADHAAQYSVAEYQPLTQWCSANYPGESA